MNKKRCKDCAETYNEEFFDLQGKGSRRRRANCTLCQQTRRDKAKSVDRWLEKARHTLHHHIISLKRTRDELIKVFGWDVHKMARDCEHTFKNTCDYCGTKFEEMVHGMADITLDIVNIKAAPFYNVNTRWVCNVCNARKKKMSTGEWGRYIQYVSVWKAKQRKLEDNPFLALPIFEFMENK
ncbi:hypothetical protein ES702_06769 [subsurface metagenome]